MYQESKLYTCHYVVFIIIIYDNTFGSNNKRLTGTFKSLHKKWIKYLSSCVAAWAAWVWAYRSYQITTILSPFSLRVPHPCTHQLHFKYKILAHFTEKEKKMHLHGLHCDVHFLTVQHTRNLSSCSSKT